MASPKRRRVENSSMIEDGPVPQDGNNNCDDDRCTDDDRRTDEACQQRQQQWHDLDQDYRRLTVEYERLQNWLGELKTEEVALKEALDQVESAARIDAVGQSRQKPSHQQAIDRLAQALLQDDDDDDSDSDDSNKSINDPK